MPVQKRQKPQDLPSRLRIPRVKLRRGLNDLRLLILIVVGFAVCGVIGMGVVERDSLKAESLQEARRLSTAINVADLTEAPQGNTQRQAEIILRIQESIAQLHENSSLVRNVSLRVLRNSGSVVLIQRDKVGVQFGQNVLRRSPLILGPDQGWGTGWMTIRLPLFENSQKLVGQLDFELRHENWNSTILIHMLGGGVFAVTLGFGLWALLSIVSRSNFMLRQVDQSSSHEALAKNQSSNRRASLAALALLISLMLVAWSGNHLLGIAGGFRHSRAVDLRLQVLSGEMRRLDEVLTMSARMGAVTADRDWYIRYDLNVRRLDAGVREAEALDSTLYQLFLAKTSAANNELVKMEGQSRAQRLAGNGRAATATLSNSAYAKQKELYTQALNQVSEALVARSARLTDDFHFQMTQILGCLILVLFAMVVNAVNLAEQMQMYSEAETDLRRKLAKARDEQEALVEERTGTLRESEGRLAATLRSIGDAVVCTDAQGIVTDINRVAEEITGWTVGNARGKPVEEVVAIHNELSGRPVTNPIRVALATNSVVDLTEGVVLLHRDGSHRPIADRSAPIHMTTGEVVGAVLVFRDITEEQHRIREVAEERRRLENVIRGTDAGIWIWDLASGEWRVDQRWTGRLPIEQGWDLEKGIDVWSYLIHPDDRPMLEQKCAEHIAGLSHILDCELRLRHSETDWFWVHLRGSVDERQADGSPRRLMGTFSDITARRFAESSLRDSERTLRHLFEGSADPVLIMREGRFIDANSAAVTALRCENLNDLLTLMPADLSPGRQLDGSNSAELSERMVEIAVREGSHRFEWLHSRLDGSLFPVEVMLTSLTIQGESVMHVVWREITDRLRMEQALRSNEQRFRSLFELAPVGIVFTNLETMRIEDVNATLLEQMNQASGTLAGRLVFDLFTDAARSVAHFAFEQLREVGRMDPTEFECQRADGLPYPVLMSSQVISDSEGTTMAWTIVQDISQRVADEKALKAHTNQLLKLNIRLNDLATRDPLTHLINRRQFLEILNSTLTPEAELESQVAVLFLDLDNFKYVNDSLGHEAGDQLLKEVANRMVGAFRNGDIVSRLGGDEFAVILAPPVDLKSAGVIAERLVKAMEIPFQLHGQSLSATVSVGVALTGEGQSVETMIQNADTAMYYAKHNGKSNWRAFEPWMTEAAQTRLELEASLRESWQRREFELHFQPIVDMTTQRIHDVEVLLRWRHPTRGLVSPLEFIPLAEEIGLISPIGLWVLEQSCLRLKKWHENPEMADLRIAVNVSGHQIARPTFLRDVRRVLRKTKLNPSFVTLEITESAVMTNLETTTIKLNALRAMGIELAIDDFGTGYSSMGTLSALPVNTVKIDRSFIAEVGMHLQPTAILRALATLCRVLKLKVVAEGIETEDQFAQASALGCQFGQGYLFARPMPEAELMKWIERQPTRYTSETNQAA